MSTLLLLLLKAQVSLTASAAMMYSMVMVQMNAQFDEADFDFEVAPQAEQVAPLVIPAEKEEVPEIELETTKPAEEEK